MSQIMLENATVEYKVVPSKHKVTAKQRAEAKASTARMLKKYGGKLVYSE